MPYHEVSCFFTLQPDSALLAIPDGHLTDQDPKGEYLTWIDLDDCADITIYPPFFRSADFNADKECRHFITRD